MSTNRSFWAHIIGGFVSVGECLFSKI